MPTFDHDRMPAYRAARELNAGCSRMISKLGAGRGDLADQLRRAAASVALNLPEGAGEFAPREKARFYRMARRSGTECAAALDALVDTGQITERIAAPLGKGGYGRGHAGPARESHGAGGKRQQPEANGISQKASARTSELKPEGRRQEAEGRPLS